MTSPGSSPATASEAMRRLRSPNVIDSTRGLAPAFGSGSGSGSSRFAASVP